GESFTAIMNGLYDMPEVRLITNRHEAAACYMAEAYAKATRNVGVCVVTRGPGATHASIGIHCANQDSTPLVLLVGQVSRRVRGREALQEMNYSHFFGDMAKWVTEVSDTQRIPQVLNRAFHVARSGRPGPVVVALPRDVLDEEAELHIPPPLRVVPPAPDAGAIQEMVDRINRAKRPVLIVGNGVQYARARKPLVAFVERFRIPAVSSFRLMDAFPNDHPLYIGNLSSSRTPARDAVDEADLVVVIGDRLAQYTSNLYQSFQPPQPLVHVDPDAAVIGRNFPVALGIVSDSRLALEAANRCRPAPKSRERAAWIAGYRKRFIEYTTPKKRPSRFASMERVVADMRAALPENSVVTVDAGLNAGWVQRYLDFSDENCVLTPNVGSMGYGFPAGMAAKLAHPARNVVSVSGDGGFMMSMMELATARQYGVKTTHVLFNNSSLGTIRLNQEQAFPDRVIATDLANPDFVAVARGFGFDAFRVSRDAEFKPAFAKAMKSKNPALVEVVTDVEIITPDKTLGEILGR
ncbi:MAG: thiamine pyrophosphate-binding protein, partial [Burkholderiales bacterium]|nr:thiamine pyrophosphate-binding protein [Burkholderiales bacterium]